MTLPTSDFSTSILANPSPLPPFSSTPTSPVAPGETSHVQEYGHPSLQDQVLPSHSTPARPLVTHIPGLHASHIACHQGKRPRRAPVGGSGLLRQGTSVGTLGSVPLAGSGEAVFSSPALRRQS